MSAQAKILDQGVSTLALASDARMDRLVTALAEARGIDYVRAFDDFIRASEDRGGGTVRQVLDHMCLPDRMLDAIAEKLAGSDRRDAAVRVLEQRSTRQLEKPLDPEGYVALDASQAGRVLGNEEETQARLARARTLTCEWDGPSGEHNFRAFDRLQGEVGRDYVATLEHRAGVRAQNGELNQEVRQLDAAIAEEGVEKAVRKLGLQDPAPASPAVKLLDAANILLEAEQFGTSLLLNANSEQERKDALRLYDRAKRVLQQSGGSFSDRSAWEAAVNLAQAELGL